MKSNNNPLVSICTLAYNHEPYTRQCLDGFLMQKTNFKFEVLIHDDASIDGTEEIIREYEAKYPDIIKALYEEENQYVLGRRGSKTFNYPRAKGKYIALCEGDDYWTDPYKLQKQVDFLEANEEYSLCFHNAIEHWEDGSREDSIFSDVEDRDYSAVEIYKKWTIPTASVVFRKAVIDSLRYKEVGSNPKFIYGDIILFLTCAEFGKLRGFTDTMSIYRRHIGGIVYGFNLKRDYKQCIHDIEIGKVFKGKEIKNTSLFFSSSRAFRVMLHCICLRDYELLSKSFRVFLKTINLRTVVSIPRIIASFTLKKIVKK